MHNIKANYIIHSLNTERERYQIPRIESQYLDLLRKIRYFGTDSDDRTGVGTRKLFGETLKVDLNQGFPLLTTKKLPFRVIAEELLWFVKGERNIQPLVLKNVNIWNEWPLKNYLIENGKNISPISQPEVWNLEMKSFINKIKSDDEFAAKWGDLGPVYGYQWRHWQNPDGTETDQLANAIKTIKENPNSRRIIVTAWNPSDIEAMSVSGLPPCHMEYQFQVDRNKLNMTMRQRSVDSFLGLPFNIASYGLLLEIIANMTDKIPNELTLFLGDVHIYKNHLPMIETQLSREIKRQPKLIINEKILGLEDLSIDKFQIVEYQSAETISAPIAV